MSLGNQFNHLSIPLIPNTLSRQDTFAAITHVLESLEHQFIFCFSELSDRVHETQNRLHVVQEGVEKARKALSCLSNTNKSTTFFSSSKYPGSDYKPYAFFRSSISKSLNFKSHSDSSSFSSIYDSNEHFNLSKEIISATNLVVFNTGRTSKSLWKSPYLATIQINDNNNNEASKVSVTKNELDDAPESFNTNYGQSLYVFSNQNDEVPELDLPQNLFLDNIALDDTHSNDFSSFTNYNTSNNANDKGRKDPETESILHKLPLAKVSELSLTQLSELPLSKPSELSVTSESKLSLTSKIETLVPKAPMPPKPPSIIEYSSSNSDRGSLLESIRKAGGAQGAGLKSIEKDTKQKNNSKVSEGDLFDDLSHRLSLRRKGMMGRDVPSIMETLSSMIEPITEPNRKANIDDNEDDGENSSDSDW